jgi:hypothetical protein
MPQWLEWLASNSSAVVRILQVPTFANFWHPFTEARTAAHISKYSGFQNSETPRHADGPFETYRTPIIFVTSVSAEVCHVRADSPLYALFKQFQDRSDIQKLVELVRRIEPI